MLAWLVSALLQVQFKHYNQEHPSLRSSQLGGLSQVLSRLLSLKELLLSLVVLLLPVISLKLLVLVPLSLVLQVQSCQLLLRIRPVVASSTLLVVSAEP